jgi:ABC-2 type transport system permease protein
MSTAVLPAPALARGADRRPGLGRLTLVELRKMTDTRAGFWLLLSTALLTVAVVVIAGFTLEEQDLTLKNFVGIATVPLSLLGPVVGILLVTSEWSQRTSLITFALVPHRGRILVAKLLAGGALAVIGYQICLATGLLATAVFGTGADDTWSLSAALIGQNGLSVVLALAAGIGFGAVLLASAPAIVLFFVLPTAWGAIGSINALEGVAKWLDQSRTMADMGEHALSGTEWARVGTSVALWVLLPIVIGFWRVKRNDVR